MNWISRLLFKLNLRHSSHLLMAVIFIIQSTAVYGHESHIHPESKTVPQLIMNLGDLAPGVQISYTEIPSGDPSEVIEILKNEKNIKSDVLLSTDSVQTYSAVTEALLAEENLNPTRQVTVKDSEAREFRFIPIGRLASADEKIARGWADYKYNASQTLKYDKLGLSIVVITTAYDSFIWIHSASLDVYQKSAMVMLNIIFASVFALDRDMWSKMTKPLRHQIVSTIDKVSNKIKFNQNFNESDPAVSMKKIVAGQFMASLIYASGFQLLRQSVISFHDLSGAVMSSSFWTMSLQIAGITTLASFAWGELLAAADAEKNPIAKSNLKRLIDARNIIMSQVASMGMVLQPSIYGSSPIVAIVVSAGLGLTALMQSHRVIEWLERNKISQAIYRQQLRLEQLVNSTANYKFRNKQVFQPAVISCQQIFQ